MTVTNDFGESFIAEGGDSKYQYTANQLSDIVILDNHHKEENSKFPDRVISSRMIVEDFKGIPALARALNTDLKTGIEGTAMDRVER